jgi:hypothetical protein
MARKDKILKSFLQHKLIKDKYNLSKTSLPNTVDEGIQSEHTIIRTISLIVQGLESSPPVTDNSLRNMILQYLNETAL